jgi:trimethylamine--corrinoid protein Co-methyltransferase
MGSLKYDLPPLALVRPEGVEEIHRASMKILSDYGLEFRDEEALAVLRENGARVDGMKVRFDPAAVLEFVGKAPSSFTQIARNPERSVTLGTNEIVFSPVYGPPYVLDRERGRRPATLEDFRNFVKLAYLCPWMPHSGGTLVEPGDEPVETRHLDMVYSHLKYSDKPLMGSVTSGPNAADSVALAEIVFGREAMRESPALVSLINVNSPRRYDERMLAALKVYARARQGMVITPFILAGAMSPCTLAGTLAQQNAEALAGIALAQMIEPGCPVVYGSFVANVDLRSGAPVFGSAETQIGAYASAQMARRYRLPFRTSGTLCTSKVPDAQAGYESVLGLQAAVLSGAHFVLHAAGWLEGGLCAGYEKFVMDAELLGMMHTWAKGLVIDDDTLALEAIGGVEPGGHHLGTEHTMAHYKEAFYEAQLFNYEAFEIWRENGAKDAYERAAEKVRELLSDYEPPPLDPAVDEALRDCLKRRKAEILGNPAAVAP